MGGETRCVLQVEEAVAMATRMIEIQVVYGLVTIVDSPEPLIDYSVSIATAGCASSPGAGLSGAASPVALAPPPRLSSPSTSAR